MNNKTCINCIHKDVCYMYRLNYICAREGTCTDYIPNRTNGEWMVKGIGINTQKNIWHLVCPKCNCDMFTEFTSYCPNCGEPKKEINIAELDMRGDEE